MKKPDARWIAYCGYYCGDCLLYKGEVADLASRLLDKLKTIPFNASYASSMKKLQSGHKALHNYHRLCEALCMLDSLRCSRACKDGGGSDTCPIRECAVLRGLEGCWECEDFEKCRVITHYPKEQRTLMLQNIRLIHNIGPGAFLDKQQSPPDNDDTESGEDE